MYSYPYQKYAFGSCTMVSSLSSTPRKEPVRRNHISYYVVAWNATTHEKYVKTCVRCQLGKFRKRKYGHLLPKLTQIIPWNQVCIDLIGPYTIKAKDKTIFDFMCLTMIDPAMSWFEIVELPNKDITYVRDKDKEDIIEVII